MDWRYPSIGELVKLSPMPAEKPRQGSVSDEERRRYQREWARERRAKQRGMPKRGRPITDLSEKAQERRTKYKKQRKVHG